MSQEIESVKPALTVILDDGDFIINSAGPVGKAMAQAVLPLAAVAHKVTIITDGEMKVMKKTAVAMEVTAKPSTPLTHKAADLTLPAGPDIQDSFVADLEAGVVGEAAMGETPSPTPASSDPVTIPQKRRPPRIFQDAAAPPAPELAEAEMERLLKEAAEAEQDAVRVDEDQRFQRQQAVQAATVETVEPVSVEVEPAAKPRARREPRSLATSGRPCGRCAGGGKIVGESGFEGACPVCHGEGTVKTWDRTLKVRIGA